MAGLGGVADRRDGGRADAGAGVVLGAGVTDVAVTVALEVGLVGVGVARAVVAAVGDAVVVDVVGVEEDAGVAGLERAGVAGVADAVVVGVELAGAEEHGRVEDVRAVVVVGLAVAVGVLGGDRAGVVAGARGDAGRLGVGGAAEEQRIGAADGGGDGGEGDAAADVLGDAGALVDAADVEGLAGLTAELGAVDDGGVAVEDLTGAHDEDDVLEVGADDRGVALVGGAVEDRDVGDEAGLEQADGVLGAGGEGGVGGDHLPQVRVAEVLVVVVGVELVGAAQLAKQVHAARGDPVGAEREVDAELVEDGDLGGVAVEDDVGARGPDDAGLLGAQQLGVVGGEADGVDDRGHGLDDVVGRVGQAQEFVAGVVVDALGDVREVGVEVVDLGGGDELGVAAALGELGALAVAEREGVAVGELDRETLEQVGGVEVSQQAALAAGAGGRGGAAHDEAQLGGEDGLLGGATGDRELLVAVLADAPVVAVLVAVDALADRLVLGEADVVVGVDEAGRDDTVGAGELGGVGGLGEVEAVTADAHDGAVEDEHGAVVIDGVGAEDGAADHEAGAARLGDLAGAGGGRGERRSVADDDGLDVTAGVGVRVGVGIAVGVGVAVGVRVGGGVGAGRADRASAAGALGGVAGRGGGDAGVAGGVGLAGGRQDRGGGGGGAGGVAGVAPGRCLAGRRHADIVGTGAEQEGAREGESGEGSKYRRAVHDRTILQVARPTQRAGPGEAGVEGAGDTTGATRVGGGRAAGVDSVRGGSSGPFTVVCARAVRQPIRCGGENQGSAVAAMGDDRHRNGGGER